MKELYIAYCKNSNDRNKTYMFDITELREFIYKQNKHYGMPSLINKDLFWKSENNNIQLSAYYGEQQINIKQIIEG